MEFAWITRFEWRKLIVQRKSLAGIGVVALINFIFGVAFWIRQHHPPRGRHHQDIPQELLAELFNAVTYSISILSPCMYLLFPMTMAVLVAHSLSGDIDTGAIRLLLARPVPRWRLLFGKWCAMTGYALGMLAVLLASSYTVASILFKSSGDMIVFGPMVGLMGQKLIVHPWPDALWRLLLAYGLASGMLAATVAMALMFAALTRHFAAAAILTATTFFCSYMAENMSFLVAINPYLPTQHLPFWKWALLEQIPWDRIGQDALWTGAYTVGFFIIAAVAFTRRDF